MRRTTILVAIILAGLLASDAMARTKAPAHGVFGTINGKTFRATNVGGAGDPCVFGIYQPNTSLVFSAIECKPRRRRQGAVRKNYKTLVMVCTNFASATTQGPPYTMPCAASVYTETKTGRYHVPISTANWSASFADVNLVPTSPVNMRVDAFDGLNVRGAISGVFDVTPQGVAAATPAQISGEVKFDFAFQIQ